ncbi:LysR substrate-binding domain-containing protein [Aeromonas media]|uniref:LysR substrate-binding domain-containing protein n=1 Tax=Aeromonas media TaxID=651 RepID=UPI003CFDF0B3
MPSWERRVGLSPQDWLIARRLFPLQLIICASPTYLRKHGVPQTLHDLGLHRCSVFRHAGTGHLIPWHVRLGESVQDHLVRPAISTNDETVKLGAVLAGEVIGQIAGPTAAAHIRAGRLVPLLLDHMTDMYTVSLLRQPCGPARPGTSLHRSGGRAPHRQPGVRARRRGAAPCSYQRKIFARLIFRLG